MKSILKGLAKWLGGIVGGALTVMLVIVLMPYAGSLADTLLPDVSGLYIRNAAILSQQLEESARLETLVVTGEGVMSASVDALFFGTVSTVNADYTYTGSYGIDLQKVEISLHGNQVVFTLPQPEVLADSIDYGEVYRDGFLDGAVRLDDKELHALFEAEKDKWRQQYLTGEHAPELQQACISAFERTILAWMSQANSRLTYTIRWATAAE
ncbi:MAG: DUF4230 domain-containing protein [Clostridia bacterium]|nr:DUF4230 domain-containing protein [Clostridia bacterium]